MQLTKGLMSGFGISALSLATLLAFASTVRAERLPLKTYTTADGLPRDRIRKIVKDSRGFLWFCTPEGLSRFDGYKFTNYGLADGLTNPAINDFIETHDGKYWVATDSGLYLFNPDPAPSGQSDRTLKFTACLNEAEPAKPVLTVFEDHAGVVWCGSYRDLYRVAQLGGQWMASVVNLDQPRQQNAVINADRGTRVPIDISINRVGGFTGNVTITPPNTSQIGIKVKPPDPQSTADSSIRVKLKIKGSAISGSHQLIFAGADEAGRVRTATLTLVIQL